MKFTPERNNSTSSSYSSTTHAAASEYEEEGANTATHIHRLNEEGRSNSFFRASNTRFSQFHVNGTELKELTLPSRHQNATKPRELDSEEANALFKSHDPLSALRDVAMANWAIGVAFVSSSILYV